MFSPTSPLAILIAGGLVGDSFSYPNYILPMILRATALMCLTGYQRWLSPHKGFSCAYRVHTGRCSCSSFAKRAIDRVGVFAWPKLQKRRFKRCKQALLSMMAINPNPGFGNRQKRRDKDRWYDNCCCAADVLVLPALPFGICSPSAEAASGADSAFNVGDSCSPPDICSAGDVCACGS